ncbi:BQ5605_C003g02118 [Microbotryum silenes-dioicae]|uniref:BQ5605_C003g02118 protein n=1 Tax=Microbotryum silenes-dioicae TaxID=796604 RepID=A0A2X0M0Q3_9BASI|nr:BQ5605_C003g02118 [Microbotryum silenes-dioicae]
MDLSLFLFPHQTPSRIPALQNHRALLPWLGQGSKRAVMLSKYTSDPSHTIPIYPVRRITSSRALTRTARATLSSRPFLPLTGPQAADDKTSIGSPGLPRPQPFFPSRFLRPSMQSPTELVKADALATTMDEWNGMRRREGVAGFTSHGFVSALFVGSHREAVPFALVSARARSRAKCNAIPSVAKLFVKAVVEAEPWRVDPYVTYRPWQDELYQLKDYAGGNKLGFGLWRDDGHCRPAAPYARALYKTKKALEAEGHTVIDWSFDDALDGLKILVDLYAADGEKGFDIACAESGEPRIFGRMNRGDGKELTASQYWELCAQRKVYVKSQLDAWEGTSSITGTGRPLDAIIGPVSCDAPEVHGVAAWGWYTVLANLHDYPLGVFAVIQVDPKLDPSAPAPASYRSATEKRIQETYDPVLYEDAPIGLQCMGRKGQDEAVLRMTEIIDAALRKAGKANL